MRRASGHVPARGYRKDCDTHGMAATCVSQIETGGSVRKPPVTITNTPILDLLHGGLDTAGHIIGDPACPNVLIPRQEPVNCIRRIIAGVHKMQ